MFFKRVVALIPVILFFTAALTLPHQADAGFSLRNLRPNRAPGFVKKEMTQFIKRTGLTNDARYRLLTDAILRGKVDKAIYGTVSVALLAVAGLVVSQPVINGSLLTWLSVTGFGAGATAIHGVLSEDRAVRKYWRAIAGSEEAAETLSQPTYDWLSPDPPSLLEEDAEPDATDDDVGDIDGDYGDDEGDSIDEPVDTVDADRASESGPGHTEAEFFGGNRLVEGN